MIRAYNEWLAEEYCAYNPIRLLAMGIIPDTGVDDAIAEMEYCFKVGLKGVNLHRFPSGKSYVTPEDDKFWEAALEMNVPICSHTFGGTTRMGTKGPIFQYPTTPKEKADRDPVSLMFRFAGEQPIAPLQMAMAGVFDRFPDLKIYWAESQAGWLPYSFDQIDDNHERNRYWGERQTWLQSPGEASERVPSKRIAYGVSCAILGESNVDMRSAWTSCCGEAILLMPPATGRIHRWLSTTPSLGSRRRNATQCWPAMRFDSFTSTLLPILTLMAGQHAQAVGQ